MKRTLEWEYVGEDNMPELDLSPRPKPKGAARIWPFYGMVVGDRVKVGRSYLDTMQYARKVVKRLREEGRDIAFKVYRVKGVMNVCLVERVR